MAKLEPFDLWVVTDTKTGAFINCEPQALKTKPYGCTVTKITVGPKTQQLAEHSPGPFTTSTADEYSVAINSPGHGQFATVISRMEGFDVAEDDPYTATLEANISLFANADQTLAQLEHLVGYMEHEYLGSNPDDFLSDESVGQHGDGSPIKLTFGEIREARLAIDKARNRV